MNERRMIDDGASALEREVLAAWEDEKAPAATRARAFRLAGEVAGIAVVAAGTTKGLAGLGAKGFGWGASWLAKGLAVALFLGASASVIATVTGAAPVEDPRVPPPFLVVRKAPVVAHVARPAPLASASPSVVAPTMVAPAHVPVEAPKSHGTIAPRGPRAASTHAPAVVGQAGELAPERSSAPRFTDEVRILGDAKAALVARDPSRALLALDTFAALYPSSKLAAEAEVLRIDAFVARGERDRAKTLATRFLAARPTSPYRSHVESVFRAE